MQKLLVSLLLLGGVACSPQHASEERHKGLPSADVQRIGLVYEIIQQISYSLFNCDTTIHEIRAWELGSMINPKKSLFLKDRTVYQQWYYLNNSGRHRKVVGLASSQKRILDSVADKESPVFFDNGGPALTAHEGVKAVIDSLFRMGFAELSCQALVVSC